MHIKQKNHSIDSLFSFLLLLIFCLFSLSLAGMGSAVYKNGTEHLGENYTSRTAIAYLTEKVRQHDRFGDIFVTSVEGYEAIGFRDVVEGEPDDGAGDMVEGDSDGEARDIGAGEPDRGARDTVEGDSDGKARDTGNRFVTYVYFYDGALCELFVREDVTPLANMGSRIVELESLEFEVVPDDVLESDNIPGGSKALSDDVLESDNVLDGSEVSSVDVLESGDTRLISATATSREGNSLSVLIPIRSK